MGNGFKYIIRKFPKLSREKTKADIFHRRQIRKLTIDPNFINCLTVVEESNWNEIVWIVKDFLADFPQLIDELMPHFQLLGCNMSIGIYFLLIHLDRSPENLNDSSEEERERFHQNICTMKEQY